MSYRIKISPRDRVTGRFIASVHRQLQQAFVRANKESGITQQKLAELLGVDRSSINRKLLGEGNLTVKTVADLAWALGYVPSLELVPSEGRHGHNHFYADASEPDTKPFRPATSTNAHFFRYDPKEKPESVVAQLETSA